MQIFKRIPEPELMDDEVQVDAYASADFSESHNRLIARISEFFPAAAFDGAVLNLGCGSGDDTFRFLRYLPKSRVIGVDGASAMIERAKRDLLTHHRDLESKVEFLVSYIPSSSIPKRPYVGIVSNSLLHHMHYPDQFWKCVADHSTKGTPIFVADLRRPSSLIEVNALVDAYAQGAPNILRDDFRNSLCAAFTEEEIIAQLMDAGLSELSVTVVGDRHIIVHGMRE